MITKLYYYISKSTNPYYNLAIEKYLFDHIEEDSLILYLWRNENTIVIGQNQNPWAECNCNLIEKHGVKIARRLSGGGAVYHDVGNLNFTFLSKTRDYNLTNNLNIIKSALALSNIEAVVSGRNDISCEGKKFSGNAFYNCNHNSYHHGTLLINTDLEKLNLYLTPPKSKLDLKGIKSVKSRVMNLAEVSKNLTIDETKKNMLSAFASFYGLPLYEIETPDDKYILPLVDKYSSWEYIYGSALPFSISLKEQFLWGNVELLLSIQKGHISSLNVYTDSLDFTLPDLIKRSFVGLKYNKEEIKTAIEKNFPEKLKEDFYSIFEKQL